MKTSVISIQHGCRATVIPTKTPSSTALERGLSILELVTRSRSGLMLSQIARNLGFPKSSIHCLLLTFEREGYLRRSESTGKYVGGMKLVRIGDAALNGIMLRETAAELLHALMNRTKLTVHMGILGPNEGIIIAKVDAPVSYKVASWIGKRLDLHCTSIGKCLIAWHGDDEIERITRENGLLRHNENTIASLPKLKQELACIRAQGYAIDDEEEGLGMRCIGAPVFDADDRVIAAVSIAGDTEEIGPHNCAELAAIVQQTASRISSQAGVFRESTTIAAGGEQRAN